MALTTHQFLPGLANEGMTNSGLAQLISLDTAFDFSIDAQDRAARTRDMSTEARANATNELY